MTYLDGQSLLEIKEISLNQLNNAKRALGCAAPGMMVA